MQQLSQPFDVCIIGGGATGLGTALDAATRGLKTILFEQYDLAKGTSSKSTKLVHGGVRYLQQGNIKLVTEALKERGLLLKNAPQIVHNQQFIVPNYKWWEKPFYGIGLKIYDKMAGSLGLGPSEFLSKEEALRYAPTLDPKDLKGGILYHDGQFDDARLAISIAQAAINNGAILLNYFPVRAFLKRKEKIEGVIVADDLSGMQYEVKAKQVINATGVFSDAVMQMDQGEHENIIQASQGIHLVVDKEFLPGDTAIMIPRTDDGRVLFAVPWHNKIVIGTTDTAVKTISAEPIPLAEEVDFVLKHIGRYLTKDPDREDIRCQFAGLRPLVKRSSQRTASLSRDHFIHVSDSGLITITGGKWTTYRKMAEDVINIVIEKNRWPVRACITQDVQLTMPGQEFIPADVSDATEAQLASYIKIAIEEELCLTVEDFLARRTRQLLLNAQTAIDLSPAVATIMSKYFDQSNEWINTQTTNFITVAKNYTSTQ